MSRWNINGSSVRQRTGAWWPQKGCVPDKFTVLIKNNEEEDICSSCLFCRCESSMVHTAAWPQHTHIRNQSNGGNKLKSWGQGGAQRQGSILQSTQLPAVKFSKSCWHRHKHTLAHTVLTNTFAFALPAYRRALIFTAGFDDDYEERCPPSQNICHFILQYQYNMYIFSKTASHECLFLLIQRIKYLINQDNVFTLLQKSSQSKFLLSSSMLCKSISQP